MLARRTLGPNPWLWLLTALASALGFAVGIALVVAAATAVARPLQFPLSARSAMVSVVGRLTPNPTPNELTEWLDPAAGVEFAAGANIRQAQLQLRFLRRSAEGAYVSPGFFQLFSIKALLGQPHVRANNNSAIVLSVATCRPNCASLLGQPVRYGDAQYFVSAIVDPSGTPFSTISAWLPAAPDQPLDLVYVTISRGATWAAARAEIQSHLALDAGTTPFAGNTLLTPMRTVVLQAAGLDLLLPCLAGALVLAVSFINVLGLVIAVFFGKQRELVIRALMGAPASTLIGRVLQFSMVPVCTGLALAYPVAIVFANRLVGYPIPARIADWTGLAAAAAWLVVLAAVIAALQGRFVIAVWCHPLASVETLARTGERAAGILLGTGAALALVAVFATLILNATLRRWDQRPLGFAPADLIACRLGTVLPEDGPPKAATLSSLQRAVAILRSTPGIQAAAAARTVPLGPERDFAVVQTGVGASARATPSLATYCSPGYFTAVGGQVIAALPDTLPCDGPWAAISRTAASAWFGNRDPLGRTLWLRGKRGRALKIAAVVTDVQQINWGLNQGFAPVQEPQVYVPIDLSPSAGFWLLLRSHQPATALTQTVAEAIAPYGFIVENALSGDEFIDAAVRPQKDAERQLSLAALIALLFALGGALATGIRAATVRRKEFAIRLSLGAMPSALAWRAALYANRPFLFGVFAGMLCTPAALVALRSFLPGVGLVPKAACAVGAAALLVAAALASATPSLTRAVAHIPLPDLNRE